MGFLGGIFRALGFESEKKIKAKNDGTKASYKLKKEENNRVEEIDGISVYYPTNADQTKEFVSFVKQDKPVIISVEACERGNEKSILDFVKGFVFGAEAKLVCLKEEKLYLILPKGVDIEE